MATPRKTDILTKALLRELYLSQNNSLQDIANEYGFRKITIKNLMERYGIEKRYQLRTLRKSDILTERLLRELYLSQNKTLEEIGKEYGFSKVTIGKLMVKCGIARRNQSQARYLAIKEGKFANFHYHDINEDFFKEWSPVMAWVLGLFFTDGCLHKSQGKYYRFTFSSMDIELIEKVKFALNSNQRMKVFKQSYDKSKLIHGFETSNTNIITDLIEIGITERKSLGMKFPEVPKEYIRHFVRGCWDGDGSVYMANGKLEVKYCCGSYDFIQRVSEELFDIGVGRQRLQGQSTETKKELIAQYPGNHYPLTIHQYNRSKSPSYELKLNSLKNFKKIFHFFYDDMDESIYLKRKHDLFVKGFEEYDKNQ
jgi:hypothetical protein